MEQDQILKRVQWMDDERRKDKDTIALLENRISVLEGNLAAYSKQIQEMSGEITRLTSTLTRVDQVDDSLIQQRQETKRLVDELDKEIRGREEEGDKVLRLELHNLDASLLELSKELEVLPRLEKGIQLRMEEDTRLSRMIDEVRAKIESMRRSEEDYTRTYRIIEDGRRQDVKRLTDLQGEVVALRKRVDEQRGQLELVTTSLRKAETRLNELLNVETERRDAQAAYMDRQTLMQVERDRVWKEWEARFQIIEKQAADVESQIQALDMLNRDVKRTFTGLEELAQRVERRMNEITEIQRLSEERFRQEWVTFKADDQKRWTNYTLTQEEQRNEMNRQFERIASQVTQLEDALQEEQDLLAQIGEQTEKRLQSLLAIAHEWVTNYERTVGRSR